MTIIIIILFLLIVAHVFLTIGFATLYNILKDFQKATINDIVRLGNNSVSKDELKFYKDVVLDLRYWILKEEYYDKFPVSPYFVSAYDFEEKKKEFEKNPEYYSIMPNSIIEYLINAGFVRNIDKDEYNQDLDLEIYK